MAAADLAFALANQAARAATALLVPTFSNSEELIAHLYSLPTPKDRLISLRTVLTDPAFNRSRPKMMKKFVMCRVEPGQLVQSICVHISVVRKFIPPLTLHIIQQSVDAFMDPPLPKKRGAAKAIIGDVPDPDVIMQSDEASHEEEQAVWATEFVVGCGCSQDDDGSAYHMCEAHANGGCGEWWHDACLVRLLGEKGFRYINCATIYLDNMLTIF